MDMSYFMKVQNAYGTHNKREKELAKVNREMSKHFEDTFDTEDVLINGIPKQLMIIKDTDNNTYKKKIKSKHEDKFNLGDYVLWNGQVWLITLIDSDEKTWNRGYMYLCTLLLHWQNKNGEIVERWGYSEDFTKYSSGVEDGKVVTIGDNQYGVTLPVDDETKHLKRDKRFIVDFEDVDVPDAYTLTNRKVLLNDDGYFGRGSLLNLTLSYGAFNSNVDKLVELPDGRKVWICDYISPDEPTAPLPPNKSDILSNTYTITHIGQPTIRYGGSAKTFKIESSDTNENVDVTWKIQGFFEGLKVTQETSNSIQLKVIDNDELVGTTFMLEAYIDEKLCASLTITVKS